MNPESDHCSAQPNTLLRDTLIFNAQITSHLLFLVTGFLFKTFHLISCCLMDRIFLLAFDGRHCHYQLSI